jgi:UDP-N-acetylenolpyruvoylglucosamine reductase
MDIVTLIQLARKEVYDKFGVKLDLEIKTLGFHPETFTV